MQLTEEGNPVDDQSAFRRTLGQFATGVTVVTAEIRGNIVGMTSNSFSSVSLDPPLILFSVKRTNQSFPLFEEATHFAINILAAEQIALSQRFAKSGPNKFDGVQCEAARSGAPLLNGAVAHLECSRAAQYDGGDHLIIVGGVDGLPPEKWSSLRYGFRAMWRTLDVEEAAQARRDCCEAAAG